MNNRNQFTFYRSYYDALRYLPERERVEIVLAICAYALDGEEPEKMAGAPASVFTLIKPTLDAARRKAEGGQKGRSGKDTDNKKEKENEIESETEKEKEDENECYTPRACDGPGRAVKQLFLKRINAKPSGTCLRELGAFERTLSPQVVLRAIEIAVDEQKTNWSYLRGILRNYEQAGVRNLRELERLEAERQRERAARQASSGASGAAARGAVRTGVSRASPIGKAALEKLLAETVPEEVL